MKHYLTLIKLKQREIDMLTKQLGNLRNQRGMLEELIATLERELQAEIDNAADLIHMGVFFADYSESNKQKQQVVYEKIQMIDQQINHITDKMMVLYGERKKFEIALKRKKEKLAYAAAQREQQMLDELARNRYDGTI
jgi:flagellar biosynthesis chaperone FliJ